MSTKLEDEIKDEIVLFYGLNPDIKLFTNPVGKAWHGIEKGRAKGCVVLEHPRRVDYGLIVGSSDLIGWYTIDGRAIMVALEVKKPTGKPTEAQINFINQVRAAGGIAGVVRSVLDCEYLFKCYREGLPLPEVA